jgi:hypothetical protein
LGVFGVEPVDFTQFASGLCLIAIPLRRLMLLASCFLVLIYYSVEGLHEFLVFTDKVTIVNIFEGILEIRSLQFLFKQFNILFLRLLLRTEALTQGVIFLLFFLQLLPAGRNVVGDPWRDRLGFGMGFLHFIQINSY